MWKSLLVGLAVYGFINSVVVLALLFTAVSGGATGLGSVVPGASVSGHDFPVVLVFVILQCGLSTIVAVYHGINHRMERGHGGMRRGNRNRYW